MCKSLKCEQRKSNRIEGKIMWKCVKIPDAFFYLCGNFTTVKNRMKIADFIKKMYHTYFEVKLGEQYKTWAHHIICSNCNSTLLTWAKDERSLTFGFPMVWQEPIDRTRTKCSFCSVNTVDITSKYKHLIKYVNLPLAVRPVPHYSEIPVPVFTWLFLPVFKESIYNALTSDADVNMDTDFDLADTAMSWSWQSVSSSPEVFNQKVERFNSRYES